jgi:hypothetical protein
MLFAVLHGVHREAAELERAALELAYAFTEQPAMDHPDE